MPKLLRMQAARAVAANLVVVSHCFLIQGKYVPGGWLPEFVHYGNFGVDIFFALSGFIIVVSRRDAAGGISLAQGAFGRQYTAAVI
jgi:exopolysaccharide production protein ExoZ